MNEELIKNLLRLKLRTCNSVINKLPTGCKDPVKNFYLSLLKGISDVTGEFTSNETVTEDKKNIQSIIIE